MVIEQAYINFAILMAPCLLMMVAIILEPLFTKD
jgi:hypothetical protein